MEGWIYVLWLGWKVLSLYLKILVHLKISFIKSFALQWIRQLSKGPDFVPFFQWCWKALHILLSLRRTRYILMIYYVIIRRITVFLFLSCRDHKDLQDPLVPWVVSETRSECNDLQFAMARTEDLGDIDSVPRAAFWVFHTQSSSPVAQYVRWKDLRYHGLDCQVLHRWCTWSISFNQPNHPVMRVLLLSTCLNQEGWSLENFSVCIKVLSVESD